MISGIVYSWKEIQLSSQLNKQHRFTLYSILCINVNLRIYQKGFDFMKKTPAKGLALVAMTLAMACSMIGCGKNDNSKGKQSQGKQSFSQPINKSNIKFNCLRHSLYHIQYSFVVLLDIQHYLDVLQ